MAWAYLKTIRGSLTENPQVVVNLLGAISHQDNGHTLGDSRDGYLFDGISGYKMAYKT